MGELKHFCGSRKCLSHLVPTQVWDTPVPFLCLTEGTVLHFALKMLQQFCKHGSGFCPFIICYLSFSTLEVLEPVWVWHPSASSSSSAPGRLKKAGYVLDKNFRFLFRKRRRWFKPAAFSVTGSSSWVHHPAKGIKFGREVKPSYGGKVCFVRLHLGDTSRFDELEYLILS